MRKHLFILLLLSIFAAVSCHKEPEPGVGMSGYGSIKLCLDSHKLIGLQTRATDLEEGLKFNNVLIVLVNNIGNVVDKKYVEEGAPVSSKEVSFTELLPGSYHVYAYANIDATAWQQSGENLISAKESTLTADTPFSEYVDRELATLTGTDVPSDPATSMLLTGHKDVSVGLTTVTDTLDLLRPVVRFKVTVRNHTPFPVQVDELYFSKFNPDRAFLLDHLNASGIPSVPTGVNYRAMPAFDPSAGDDDAVAANSDETIYQRLMYENAYSGLYKIYATLTLDRSSEFASNLQLSLGDHPFGALDYETLNQMDEDEQVDVLVVNPQGSVRSGRILCYVSSDNNMVWESAGHPDYEGYLARARAIWDQDDDYNYSSRYSYSNANGFSGWDGLNASAGSQATHFDYTDARSRYFHTLTKANGVFTLSGLAIQQNNSDNNGKCVIPMTGLLIEKGASQYRNNEWKNPEDLSDKLVRLKLSANNQYIQCDALWSASKPNKLTNLKARSGNDAQPEHSDRQFMLIGKYMSGGPLKRILKENNKEVPLTYMARNEEINVILNVYYSDTEGQITFQVDNSTWSTPTTSSHTFK